MSWINGYWIFCAILLFAAARAMYKREIAG